MNEKQTGVVILAIAVLFFIVMFSITQQLNELLHAGCVHPEGTCPMESYLPWQSYAGFSFVLILGVFGGFLIWKGKASEHLLLKKEAEKEKLIKTLGPDEEKVYNNIIEAKGAIFQAELVEKTGFSKVKVTRILDRLEGSNVIERRRRGMTNMVLLKHTE